MAVIQIQVGKNIVEDVLLNGGASVTKNLQTKLGLGTFTNIGAIGIITNVLFFMFLCQKLY
jgi:hypothetical protein